MRLATQRWSMLTAVVALALPASALAEREGAVATLSVAGSSAHWTPVVGYGCLELTVTTPDPDQTFEKAFGSGEYPMFELPAGALDGSYRWRLLRSEQPCHTASAPVVAHTASTNLPSAPITANAAEDRNGRSASRPARPNRIPSGPSTQSGQLRVQQGSFVIPSDAPERRGR